MNNAHMIAPLQQVQSLENKLNEVETSLKDVVIPLLLDNWVEEENIFVQNITVDGLSGDIVPLITLSTVGEIATDDENYSYACISDVVITEGNIKFIANEKPSISFTVIAKGVNVGNTDVVANVTELVGKVSELENKVENKIIVEPYSFGIVTLTETGQHIKELEMPIKDGYTPYLIGMACNTTRDISSQGFSYSSDGIWRAFFYNNHTNNTSFTARGLILWVKN